MHPELTSPANRPYPLLTRRRFLWAAVVSSAVPLLAACTTAAPPAAAPTTAAAAPTSAAAAAPTTAPAAAAPPTLAPTAAAAARPTAAAAAGQPRRGGEVRFAPNSEPDSLDLHVAAQSSAIVVMMNVIDTLVLKNPDDNQYVPYLADSWTISSDGTTYTFKLHSGIKFHDGTPFNADAVKFNLDRIVNPDTQSKFAVTLLGPYDSTRVVDELTAEVKMKNAYPPLLDALSTASCGMQSPTAIQKAGQDAANSPVGTGIMKFQKYTLKDSVELVRNDDYNWAPSIWKHTGPAYLDKLTFPIIPEPASRVTALESGDVGGIEDTPGQDVVRLKGDPRFTLIEGRVTGAPRTFFLNTERAPLDDVNVRKALIYGLDRQQVIQLALFGLQPVATGPFSATLPGYSKKVEGLYPFDVNKAGQLLDDAGWKMGSDGIRQKDGQPLSLIALSQPAFQNIYVAAQSLFRNIGVDFNVRQLDAAAFTAGAHRGDHHVAMTGLIASDPSNISLLYHSRNYNSYDWSRWRNADFDKLWDDAAVELDDAKRNNLYEQIQLYIMNNALALPTQEILRLNFIDAKVKGIRQDARGIYPWFYDTYRDA